MQSDCMSPCQCTACCAVQVELSNISFRYPTRSDIVALQDVTLKLEPGKLVALVGLSGSGKSTLVALLQRLYDPNSGQVCPLLPSPHPAGFLGCFLYLGGGRISCVFGGRVEWGAGRFSCTLGGGGQIFITQIRSMVLTAAL